jgi:D-alanyl-D-alanine dipeptidase
MRFENQETDGVDQLNESTAAGLQCMQASAKALKANFRLSAAYRPIQYQLHLLSVWNAYILKDINQPPQYCTTLQQQGAKEKQYHHIVYPPASTPSAPHVRGNAIDAKITKLPAPYTIDTFANSCKMDRRVPEDKIHFEPIHVKWNTDTLTSWFSN